MTTYHSRSLYIIVKKTCRNRLTAFINTAKRNSQASPDIMMLVVARSRCEVGGRSLEAEVISLGGDGGQLFVELRHKLRFARTDKGLRRPITKGGEGIMRIEKSQRGLDNRSRADECGRVLRRERRVGGRGRREEEEVGNVVAGSRCGWCVSWFL